ncbi:MAG: phage capsid protein [Candidatus Paceibacterota bacterium]|jgi:hypothetical protein
MASVTGLNTPTTNANEIPEMWSDLVIKFRQANLVMRNLVTDRSADLAGGGDIVHFPVTAAHTATAYTDGKRLSDNLAANTTGVVDLTVDQFYFSPVMVQWTTNALAKYDIKADRMAAAGIAIATKIDSTLLALQSDLTATDINTPAAADQTGDLTLAHIISAYTTLNSSNVPTGDRAWVFHPTAYGELLGISGNYFTSFDFRNGKPLENGVIGSILGSNVYQSSNVATLSTGSPAETGYANMYFHKDAFGLAMVETPTVSMSWDEDTMSDLGSVRAAWGVKTLRADHGVVIRTVND